MRRTAAMVAGAVVLVAAGCGEDESFSNDPSPPAPIVLTASINKNAVSLSPSSIGAGPVSLIITNQTSAAQEVTFGTSGGSAGFEQQTGPINPGGTATLKAVVPQGRVTVKVQSDAIDPAELKVGEERPSAQNELLQP